eukprot:NODE_649_length_1456_cov_354.899076_g489_i0.p1 GENE.NODE_649_length_1456_cov_354.899076_g489_i0~~NODE_649_length_1456_cov_354.899076_g489_i0.p1  ORF type:complete len:438 (+),score=109.36 NODE_649_length_1456_cov_354.899076_g489_i0:62-1315(+)
MENVVGFVCCVLVIATALLLMFWLIVQPSKLSSRKKAMVPAEKQPKKTRRQTTETKSAKQKYDNSKLKDVEKKRKVAEKDVDMDYNAVGSRASDFSESVTMITAETISKLKPKRAMGPHWKLYYAMVTEVLETGGRAVRFSELRQNIETIQDLYLNNSEEQPSSSQNPQKDNPRHGNAKHFHYDKYRHRLAFLLLRCPKRVSLISSTLHRCEIQILPLFELAKREKRPFTACAIGGGPTSDLIGMLAYINSLSSSYRCPMQFLAADLPEWTETSKIVSRLVPKWFPDVKADFEVLDVLTVNALPTGTSTTDLFIFSFMINELLPFADGFKVFFRRLVENAKQGAMFFCLDTIVETVDELRNQLVETGGLTVQFRQDSIELLESYPKFHGSTTNSGLKTYLGLHQQWASASIQLWRKP